MVSVHEAKQIIDTQTILKRAVYELSSDLVGMVLAGDITAQCNVPSFDNSAMDGYAFCFQKDKASYQITQKIKAGEVSENPIGLDEAARIYTGAPIPMGTDTVIQQEIVSIQEGRISFDPQRIRYGANVRLQGSQCRQGDIVAKAGSLITPGMIGLMASVGATHIPAYIPPKISIITTGDELITLKDSLTYGKIYNSNSVALQAYCKQLNIQIQSVRHIPDDPDITLEHITDCLASCDMLILTGGISVGDYDYIRSSLNLAGVTQRFYKVKQKPGKPLFFGNKDNTLVFALPGNPAAVLACFNQYIKPCIRKMMGFSAVWEPDAVLPLQNTYQKHTGLTHFAKAYTNQSLVRILSGQQSFDLLPFNESNCFAEIPEDIAEAEPNSLLSIYYW